MIILGIDPGIERVGWGVVALDGGSLKYHSSGCIKTPRALGHSERIALIAREIEALAKREKPDEAVVEKLFFAKNKKTAFLVSEARGAIMLVLHMAGIKTREYTPLEVKRALTGNGRAEKRQVAWVVKNILGIKDSVTSDDALDALALCFLGGNKLSTTDGCRTYTQ